MRYGIFSDVHGNLEAMTAVRKGYEEEQIDRFVCLGDMVGYGANPNEICNIVRDMADVVLLGNHDAAVSGRMDYSYYYDAARHALDWCARRMTPENLAFLKGLPYTHREGDLEFCHGSPAVPQEFEYIFTREKARELLPSWDRMAWVTFIGHSHLTRCFALTPNEVYDVVASEFELQQDYKYIITVGSVGQPRDYDNRSCCTILDTDTWQFRYKRVEYDIESAKQKIIDAGLAYNFGARLLVGI
ncbi:MAG: metallophosphoesterase family protein [Deltaproteobacteria bacterium]|nr:metallophosphoesterase family protein [Deltaproteobacteria bacterium]